MKMYYKSVIDTRLSEFLIQQVNYVSNDSELTLRGMHAQKFPHQESKLVSVLEGEIWDVILDMRTESPTYGQHLNFYLNQSDNLMLYVPSGFFHGYLTLKPNTKILYFSNHSYEQTHEVGLAWNDPKLNIKWPATPKVISEKDKKWPYLV